MNQTELESLTLNDLYNLAKQHGIPSFRKYKKAQLVEMLQAPAPAPKKRGRPPKTAEPASEPDEVPAPEAMDEVALEPEPSAEPKAEPADADGGAGEAKADAPAEPAADEDDGEA